MNNDKKIVEKIKQDYAPKNKQISKVDELKNLDKKVKQPVNIFSYVFGSVGSLVLGTGMCLAMGIIGNLMPLGIVVGLLGIGMVSATYPLHNKLMTARKNKYAKQILEKSNEILNEQPKLVEGKELNLFKEETQNFSAKETKTQSTKSLSKDNEFTL